MNTTSPPTTDVDPWEFQQFQQELSDWEFTANHHMHKSCHFDSCRQALQWHALAKDICDHHGRECLFYLGNVGSGRIDMDILNPTMKHLTREDLEAAVKLNGLERTVKGA